MTWQTITIKTHMMPAVNLCYEFCNP